MEMNPYERRRAAKIWMEGRARFHGLTPQQHAHAERVLAESIELDDTGTDTARKEKLAVMEAKRPSHRAIMQRPITQAGKGGVKKKKKKKKKTKKKRVVSFNTSKGPVSFIARK